MAMAMRWKRIILLEFIGFLLLSSASFPRIFADSDTKEGGCWYILEVKTLKVPLVDTGTKNHVRVRIADKNGINVTDHYLSEPIEGDKEDPFGKGNTAKFNISGLCLQGEVCTLQFQVEGNDKWSVKEATVQTQNNQQYPFPFPKRLPQKTWDGYICGEDEQRPSDHKNRNLRENSKSLQTSCARRSLLKFGRRSKKSGRNGGKYGNNDGENDNNTC